MRAIIKSFLFTAVVALVIIGCQKASTESDAMLKKSFSADNSYLFEGSGSNDGFTYTFIITKNPAVKASEAKNVSHILVKAAACCPVHEQSSGDIYWLMDNIVEHLVSVEVNGNDYLGSVETAIGRGTGCWFPVGLSGHDDDPWNTYAGRVFKINFEEGLSYPLTITITFDQQVRWATVLLKAGSDFCGGEHNDGEPFRKYGPECTACL